MTLNSTQKFCLLTLVVLCLTSCGRDGSSSDNTGSGFDPRIINGTPIAQTELPQVVRLDLVFADEAGNPQGAFCTATVISEDEVLSAGHCAILSGTLVQADIVSINGTFSVSDVYIHPQFGFSADGYLVNDVAVFHTNTPMGLPVLPITLSHPIQSDDVIGIFGYGLDESGLAGELKGGTMTVAAVLIDVLLSIFDDSGNTCFGDSGGPATFTAADGSTGLVGVTSAGSSPNCAPGETSSFINLQSPTVLAFIQAVVPEVVFN